MASALTRADTAPVDVVASVPSAFAALVRERAPESIALSGGATARRCYERLASTRPDWRAVDVYFGDERWVDQSHRDSNEGMARAALLETVHPHCVHSMRGAGDTPAGAAARYDLALRAAAALDFVHLGLGPDGHTASLFPGGGALEEPDRFVVATGDLDHPHERLTITLPALATARFVVFTVEGADKRDAFARVRSGEDLPAARVEARDVLWLVDPPAAGVGAAGTVA